MAAACYCYCAQNECTLLKFFYSFSATELNDIEIEDEDFAQEFSYEKSDYGNGNDGDN